MYSDTSLNVYSRSDRMQAEYFDTMCAAVRFLIESLRPLRGSDRYVAVVRNYITLNALIKQYQQALTKVSQNSLHHSLLLPASGHTYDSPCKPQPCELAFLSITASLQQQY